MIKNVRIGVDVNQFAKEYGKSYEYLYTHHGTETITRAGVDIHLYMMEIDPIYKKMVHAVATKLQDIMISDRECTAFLLTYLCTISDILRPE